MRLVAAFTTCAFLATGCGPSWPSGATSLHAPRPTHPIATVDVLPLDLEMWSENGFVSNPAEVRGVAEATLANAALETLVQRHYAPNAMIDWDGNFGGGRALERPALLATIGSLAHYGTSAPVLAGQLRPPGLPARLGTSTNGDATLYIGGWSYIASPRESKASEVARDVVIGLLVIATVAIVIAAVSSLDKDKHGSHGHESGGGHGDHRGGGGGGSASHWHGHEDHAVARATANLAIDLVDAFGHAAAVDDHPEYVDDPALPHDGEESKLYLEMTLVDNHTGEALWHAHQTFPASGASQGEVARAAKMLLATLPAS
jgi:hypothetical protein